MSKYTPMLTMSQFATQKDYWEYRAQRAEAMLRAIYEEWGPGSLGGGNGRESVESYAAMTKRDIDSHWDFPERELMHEIAKILASIPTKAKG